MTFDRKITLVSIAFAIVASVAASLQSYLAWRGRNDALTSAALGQVVGACHDVAYKVSTISAMRDFSTEQMQDIEAQLGALDVVVDAIYPSEHLPMQKIFEDFATDALHADLNATSNELKNIRVRFVVDLRAKCTEIIQRQIGG